MPCLTISPCLSWDVRKTQPTSLPHTSSCSSPKSDARRLMLGVAILV